MEHVKRDEGAAQECSVQRQSSIGITIFGVLAIVWGVWFAYRFVVYAACKPWSGFEEAGVEGIRAPIVLVGVLVPAAYVISGLALLKRKAWSRYCLLVVTGLLVWGLMTRFIIAGPSTEGSPYLIHFGVAALFMWFLNRKSTKAMFPYHKGLRALAVIWILGLSLCLVPASVFWFTRGGGKIPRLQNASYRSRPESAYAEGFFRSPFPFEYTLAIPNGFTVHALSQPAKGVILVSLGSSQEEQLTHMIMGSKIGFEKLYSLARILGYDTPYGFARKLFSERYGVVFLILRRIPFRHYEPYQLEEVKINDLRGFITRATTNDKALVADYYLFCGKKDVVGKGRIRVWREDPDLAGQEIDEIISSMRLQDEPFKTAEELFNEGMRLLEDGEIERAEFSLASALCLDWEDADCHYHLGRAFLATENLSGARERLEKVVSLEHNYPGARELLEEVITRQKEARRRKEG